MSIGGDTRERIKVEAMKLFVARGIDIVSIRDIADRVGMKPSNLYAHFRSRDELIRELFAEGYAAYGRRLSEIASRDAPFIERLDAMIRLVCLLHDQDGVRFRFLLLAQHTTLARLPKELVSPVVVVQRAVTAAVQAKEIPGHDPVLLTAMIIGVVLQAATFRLYGRLTSALETLADELADAAVSLALREPRTRSLARAEQQKGRRRRASG